MNSSSDQGSRSISLFFGHKHQSTLREFEELARDLRRSRTGTLHFLMTHYKWYKKHNLTPPG